jgi:hypothetical protein
MAADSHKAALAPEKGEDLLAGRTAGGYCRHLYPIVQQPNKKTGLLTANQQVN